MSFGLHNRHIIQIAAVHIFQISISTFIVVDMATGVGKERRKLQQLRQIEIEIQQKWESARVFEVDAGDKRLVVIGLN